jgi:hypothetical protein
MRSGRKLLAIPVKSVNMLVMKIKRYCKVRKVTRYLMLLKLLTNLLFLLKTKWLVRYVVCLTMQLRIVEG